jgi:hypothetical protein
MRNVVLYAAAGGAAGSPAAGAKAGTPGPASKPPAGTTVKVPKKLPAK